MYREAIDIRADYKQFGIELGLPLREMDAVRKQHQHDIPQAFTEVLVTWLKQSYNVEKYGPPTWRKLVEAVDHPAGGNNHSLAKTIAERHPVERVASAEDYRYVMAKATAGDHVNKPLEYGAAGDGIKTTTKQQRDTEVCGAVGGHVPTVEASVPQSTLYLSEGNQHV